jgi:hypothetical protein
MDQLMEKCHLLLAFVLNVVAHVFRSPITELVENRHQRFSHSVSEYSTFGGTCV